MTSDPLDIFTAGREAPDELFLMAPDQQLSLAEVASRCAGCARWLQKHGVAPEQVRPVAFVATPTLETLCLQLTLVALRIPLFPLHPKWTPEECDKALRKGEESARQALRVEVPPSFDADGVWPDITPQKDTSTPAAVLHTSGSSGGPKGIVLSRHALIAAVTASGLHLPFQSGERWLLCLPTAHVGGLSILLRCLAARSTVTVPRLDRAWGPLDAEEMVSLIRRCKVSRLSVVPGQLQQLASTGAPTTLRHVLVGGGPASAPVLAQAREFGWPVRVTYGSTESASQLSTQLDGHEGAHCGTPLPSVELRVRDGIIEVRGPMLFSGYYPDTPAPLNDDGWFSTQDLGRIDAAGHLWVEGRRDEVIISGGENVFPQEVEAALCGHPQVRDAVLFGIADDRWGQVVCAALLTAGGREPQNLRRWCEEHLSTFKRPRLCSYHDAFPLLANGKVDRQTLRLAPVQPPT